MFLALMQYFTFSSKLSMFYSILKSAMYDTTFFTIIFIVINLGFSIMGHMIFGISNESFNSLLEIAMSNILMIIGDFPISQLETQNLGLLVCFSVTFLIMNMILLNMFIAIIGTHYFEFYIDMGTVDEISLLKIIIKIFLDRYYDKKKNKPHENYENLESGHDEEEEEQEQEEEEEEKDDNLESFEENIQKPLSLEPKSNRCRKIFKRIGRWLIDYANSKPEDEVYFEIIESVEGVSHLEITDLTQHFKALNICGNSSFGTLNENLSDDSDHDEFYELECVYPRGNRNELNFWVGALA